MYNDYIIVGPKEDPAGVKGLPVTEAFQKILSENAVFVSRGDDSGTHKKEVGIWETLGLTPTDNPNYASAGQGMLGDYALLYTPTAIVLAQILVSFPIVVGLTSSSFQQIDEKMLLQIKALGATKMQTLWILLKELRIAILAAIMAGFGRVIAEVGAAMMVGGNILGETRILTTSIMMEVSKGNFDVAIALSIILMSLAFFITFCLTALQQRRHL